MKGLHKSLPDAFAKVTSNTCKGIIAKIIEQEDKYWFEDEKLDEEYINAAAEEYLGRKLYDESLERYLDEM